MLPNIGSRSTCDRGQCGAIAVRDNSILSTGYAGAPRSFPHCDDLGHDFEYNVDKPIIDWIDTGVIEDWHEADWMHRHNIEPYIHKHCIRTIHAEMNCIYNAANVGVSLKGGTLYTSMFPCVRCAMAIVQVGITTVIAANTYHSSERSMYIFDFVKIPYTIVSAEELYTK
jgi:dCMP deaminase